MNHPSQKEMVVMCDVDETLVLWHQGVSDVYITDPYGIDGAQIALKRHNRHIKLLKDKSKRGYYIIVWSAGGEAWANAVVDALGIRDFVNDVIAKPVCFIDDLPAEAILVNRVYLEDK